MPTDLPDALVRWIKRLPHRTVPFWRGQAIAVICVCAAAALRLLLDHAGAQGIPFITFFPAVLLASVAAGVAAGSTALVLSALVAAYFWLPPNVDVNLYRSSWIALISFLFFGAILVVVSEALRVAVATTLDARNRAHVLAQEMKHRVQNVISVILGISAQSARNASDLEDYRSRFEARVVALSRAQELVSDHADEPVDLRRLLTGVLEPFELQRFRLNGHGIGISGEIGSPFALLVHELATNALKYGALSVATGMVDIRWYGEGDFVVLTWSERGGPPVARPEHGGFGSRLMKTAFPADHGETHVEFAASGVECTIRVRAVKMFCPKGSRDVGGEKKLPSTGTVQKVSAL